MQLKASGCAPAWRVEEKMSRLYYSEPYRRELDVTITKIDGKGVFFDRTIFYPEGGGQPGDRGTFCGLEITDTRKRGEESEHIFKTADGLFVGMKGKLELSWSHRYSFMKRHSAQHLLSALLFSLLDASTVAVHLSYDYITIELDKKDLEESSILAVEDRSNSIVREARAIYQKDMTQDEALALNMRRSIKVESETVKVVFIDGLDAVACGGLHVRNTSEIGEISYYRSERIRGHIRLIFKIDDEAVKERRRNLSVVNKASELLSSPPDLVAEALKRKLDELDSLRHEIRAMRAEEARKEAERMTESCSVYETGHPLDYFRELKGRVKDVLVLRDGEKKEFLYIGLEEHFTELKKVLSLKGGGRDGLFQGSFSGGVKDISSSALEVLNGFKG